MSIYTAANRRQSEALQGLRLEHCCPSPPLSYTCTCQLPKIVASHIVLSVHHNFLIKIVGHFLIISYFLYCVIEKTTVNTITFLKILLYGLNSLI